MTKDELKVWLALNGGVAQNALLKTNLFLEQENLPPHVASSLLRLQACDFDYMVILDWLFEHE